MGSFKCALNNFYTSLFGTFLYSSFMIHFRENELGRILNVLIYMLHSQYKLLPLSLTHRTKSIQIVTSLSNTQNNTAATSEPITQPPTTPSSGESVDDDSEHSAVVYLLLSISLILLALTIVLHLGLRSV